jgi:hypothetical protein
VLLTDAAVMKHAHFALQAAKSSQQEGWPDWLLHKQC